MADDMMVGFKFDEDYIARDADVLKTTELLFAEAGIDSKIGHLRNGEEDEIRLKPADFDGGGFFESFDYADGFEFGM